MATDFPEPQEDALSRLKDIVGDSGWLTGSDAARYLVDPRGRFEGHGRLVLRPDNTKEVARIVALCNELRLGLIPYGGGTGVVAGQLSPQSDNAIILSLERMDAIRDIRKTDGVMIVEAGCILQDIHDTAAAQGLMFPLSMASKGSCRIGGNLATNAGGIQVVRHGNMRELCLGIEAVLPSGAVYDGLSALRKDNTGYDLRHLLIGSEGTLGVITAATLLLKPVDPETATAFCAVASPAAALALYQTVRADLGEAISALELMSRFGVGLVTGQFPALSNPIAGDPPWYLLLEAGGPMGLTGRLEQALAEGLDDGLLLDAAIAQSDAQRAAMWSLREYTPEANRLAGVFCSSDTSVPLGKVGAFIDRTVNALSEIHPDLRINTYGHIGDGNIHHNVLPPIGWSKADFLTAHPGIAETVRMAINEATVTFGGSISAEHGIGRLKTDDLKRFGDNAKYTALRQIKSALDPNNILNPGAILA